MAGDTVLIPDGITVTLDTDVVVSQANTCITVNGVLRDTFIYLNGPHYFPLSIGNGAGFTGNGTVHLNLLNALPGLVIDIDDSMTIGTLNCSGMTQYKPHNILTIKNNFAWVEGDYIFSAGTLILDTAASITIESGKISVPSNSSAVFDFSRPHTIHYANLQPVNTGAELDHGIQSKDILIDAQAHVALSKDLHLFGNLILKQNSILLNGHNLIIQPTGDILNRSGFFNAGTIGVDKRSDMEIYATTGITDPIPLSFQAEFKRLVINMGSKSSVVSFASDCSVYDSLLLIQGRLDIGLNTLYILDEHDPDRVKIFGGSEDSYIITQDEIFPAGNVEIGWLEIYIHPGKSAFYPVGNYEHFTPVTITQRNSAPDYVSIAAIGQPREKAAYGYNLSANQPVVSSAWAMRKHYSVSIDSLDVTVSWPGVAEKNGFDRNKAFLSQYIDDNWYKTKTVTANTLPGNYYSLRGQSLKESFFFMGGKTYLSVFDEKTSLSLNNTAIGNNIKIYPNPPTQLLYADVQQPARALIYNAAGQVVSNTQVDAANKSINIAALPPGMYIIKLAGDELNAIGRFVKQ